MSRRRREGRILGLALTGVAWETEGNVIASQAVGLPAPGLSLAEATPFLRDGLQAALSSARGAMPAAGARHVVVVAGSLARHWLMVPPANAGSLKELQQVAQVRCSQLFGSLPADWVLAGDWDASHPFVCAALPRWVVDTVRTDWTEQPALSTVLSLWISQAQAVLPSRGWCCLNTPGHGAILGLDGGRIVSLRIHPWSAAADPATRRAGLVLELQRELLRRGTALGDTIRWIGSEQSVPGAGALPGVRFEHLPLPWDAQAVPEYLSADEAGLAVWVARQSGAGR